MNLCKEKPMLSVKAIFFDTNAASRYMGGTEAFNPLLAIKGSAV